MDSHPKSRPFEAISVIRSVRPLPEKLMRFAGILVAAVLLAASPVDDPTPSAGSIAPVAATASGSEACSPSMLIDGSGLREVPSRPGVFVHLSNRWIESGAMWAGRSEGSWLSFDLGRTATVTGLHVWNYNEQGGWQNRSVKSFELLVGADGKSWQPAGSYSLRCASGRDDEAGQRVDLARPTAARFLKIVPTSNYGRDNHVGLSEIRVYVADPKPGDRILRPRPPFKARYSPTRYPARALGKPFAGSENIAWPQGAVIDLTQPPYSAKGDGTADDTSAINRALADHADRGAILFLPNGIYRLRDTLKWGRGEKYTTLMGQSEKGTVLKLDDHAPGFDSPGRAKPLVWTGGDPAQRFGNEIAHLTFDTGSGNPGCSGVAFVANNQGAIHHVSIVSGDGQGLSGLALGAAGENGPLLVRSVTIIGFDVGVAASSAINGQVIEGLTLRDQNLSGIRNHGQHLSLRKVISRNEGPALEIKSGVTVLLDSILEGSGTASGLSAVTGSGTLYLRNVTSTGYARVLEGREGIKVDEYASAEAVSCFPGPKTALKLSVQELPPVSWEAPEKWASPLQFGGKPDDRGDQSAAIQKAVDSGASTVWLPRGLWRIGAPVVLRGKLRRLVGCRATLETLDGRQRSEPLLRVEDGAGSLEVERINGPWHGTRVLVAETRRTVVVRHCGNVSLDFSGGGDVFLDDVVNNPGANFRFKGGTVWARQLNPEAEGVHVLNDGATLWIFGMKTESKGTLIETRGGGSTEVIGGLSYTSGGSGGAPMFTVADSRFSMTLGEVCWDDRYYRVIVRETRRGVTQEFKSDDPRWGRSLALFATHGK
jgi:hypothetical protein